MGYINEYIISKTISHEDFQKIANTFKSFISYTNHKLFIQNYYGCNRSSFHNKIYGSVEKEALVISFSCDNDEVYQLPNIETFGFFQTNRNQIDLAVKLLLIIANKITNGNLTFSSDKGGNNQNLWDKAYELFNSLESRIYINNCFSNDLFFNIILPYLDGPLNKNFSFK